MKARKPVLTIGFAFAAQHILQVPREGHDQRLDLLDRDRRRRAPLPRAA